LLCFVVGDNIAFSCAASYTAHSIREIPALFYPAMRRVRCKVCDRNWCHPYVNACAAAITHFVALILTFIVALVAWRSEMCALYQALKAVQSLQLPLMLVSQLCPQVKHPEFAAYGSTRWNQCNRSAPVRPAREFCASITALAVSGKLLRPHWSCLGSAPA
jgi:hypothetical protein